MEWSVRALRILLAILPMGLPVQPQLVEMKEAAGLEVSMGDLKFKYYNRNYPTNPYLINIENNNFVDELKNLWQYQEDLKIITHGWVSSETSGAVGDIKDAYLAYPHNVITLDWSKTASTKNYPVPAMMTLEVGKLAAQVVNRLVELNFTQFSRVHMIGHSLGSHVSGATGAHCKEKIARITGLDPAGPGFNYLFAHLDMRLDESDALFVDIIHTAAGMAGYSNAIGHADFYPNSGKSPQPGCAAGISIDIYNTISSTMAAAGCSHMRAYELFTESIGNPQAFRSVRCDSWSTFESGQCNTSDVVYMGDPCTPTAKGVYYLATNAKPPYSISEIMRNSVSDIKDSISDLASSD